MSYPLLRISRAYAHVEVRRGRGAQRWEEMAKVFNGPADRGKEWKAGEGDKLSARHCMWPSDPNSTLSLPYTASGTEGLETGRPELLVFPSGVFSTLMSSDDDEAFSPPVLHEDPGSGNCYKIRLTAALLGLPIGRRFYDIRKGETRTPEFLRDVNANGRIPVLEVGGRFLPESNAACWYLAEGSPLIPEGRFARADMLHWMFFEQYNHEPNVATLRWWLAFVGEANLSEAQRGQIMAKRAGGEAALGLMEDHLATREWFVDDSVSLADIALYAYTHVCEAGGFRLHGYPAIRAWLARVAALPGYVAMD